MTQIGHRIKWDHFDILATGQSDIHCKIKETLLIGRTKTGQIFVCLQTSYHINDMHDILDFPYSLYSHVSNQQQQALLPK